MGVVLRSAAPILCLGEGEVEMREFAKMLDCRSVVTPRRRFRRWEVSEEYLSAVNLDLSQKVLSLRRYSLKSALVGFVRSFIERIMQTASDAEIAVSIVQRAVIYMIPLVMVALTQPKDVSVHEDYAGSFTVQGKRIPRCIETLYGFAPLSSPVPLHKVLVPVRGNNSELPLCEGNVADRLIERLNKMLALHAAFGHDLTSNEIAAVQPRSYCTSTLEVA